MECMVLNPLPGPEMQSFNAFRLEGLKECLRAGVFIGCARTAHALDTADLSDLAAEVTGGILTASLCGSPVSSPDDDSLLRLR